MPFEPKLIVSDDELRPYEMRRSDEAQPLGHERSPLESESLGLDVDFSELPDELAELAFQLSDDAELLARRFPAPSVESTVESESAVEGTTVESIAASGGQRRSQQDSSPCPPMWIASPWTRAAALVLLCSTVALGVSLLSDHEEPGVADARFRQTPDLNRPIADIPSPERSTEIKEIITPGKTFGGTPIASEPSASPVFISADDAEFLNGEKIEVLADVLAEQLAKI